VDPRDRRDVTQEVEIELLESDWLIVLCAGPEKRIVPGESSASRRRSLPGLENAFPPKSETTR
jgi:hypothetical protein